jgi:tyrosyl-tRNA synthetase
VHGREEADKALAAARALFEGSGDLSSAPRVQIGRSEIEAGMDVLTLLSKTGVCPSKSEARRLVQGNGLLLNGEKCTDVSYKMQFKDFEHSCGGLLVRKGKKDYTIIELF